MMLYKHSFAVYGIFNGVSGHILQRYYFQVLNNTSLTGNGLLSHHLRTKDWGPFYKVRFETIKEPNDVIYTVENPPNVT